MQVSLSSFPKQTLRHTCTTPPSPSDVDTPYWEKQKKRTVFSEKEKGKREKGRKRERVCALDAVDFVYLNGSKETAYSSVLVV